MSSREPVIEAMWVKICANTNSRDAKLAVELGADAVGFVFAESKRQVTVEQVAAITHGLPESVEKIGVFTTGDAEQLVDSARGAGLTGVQVHREFDPVLVRQIKLLTGYEFYVIQVIEVPVGGGEESELELELKLLAVLQEPAVDAVLLDAAVKGVSGGTGVAFDWARVAAVVREAYAAAGARGRALPDLIVAGGLHAENIGAAIAEFAPWGVDVASGVEAVPGIKDAVRLQGFIENARAAGDKLNK